VSYELLLHETGGADTVVIAHCPDLGAPWAMRGVQRHSEADLVKVDGTMVRVDQAIQLMDFLWDDVHMANGLVDASLLQQAYEEHQIHVSDDDLQAAMDDFRRRRGLRTREQTLDWLHRHGTTQERLEFFVADRARRDLLRDRVTRDGLEAWFEAHREALASVVLAVVEMADGAQAQALRDRAGDTEAGLFRAACDRLVGLAGSAASHGQELLQVRRRWELPAALAREAFSRPMGTVIGPVEDDGVFRVACVIARHAAVLDDETHEHARRRMFDAWLDERRRRATIEWYWGRGEPLEVP
jgi:putative peptide maturation system protein